jgi:hypothetical protein
MRFGGKQICNSWSIHSQCANWRRRSREGIRGNAREREQKKKRLFRLRTRVLSKCEWRYFSLPFYTYRMSTKYSSTWHSHPVIIGWPFLLVSPAGISNVRVLPFWLMCSHLIEAKGSRKARSQFSRWYLSTWIAY